MSALLPTFISPSRCVLVIMDDGVSLYLSSMRGISFVESIHWRTPGFTEKLAETLGQTKAGSVVILSDAVEQHYRKEKVPALSFFDKANIVQRRLNVAFPNYAMRAATVLKNGTKAIRAASAGDKEAAKGDLYLFAAVPSTDAFSRIMTAIAQIDIQIVGFGLLPIESTSAVDRLVAKLSQKKLGVGSATWSILLTQHRGGGFRQVVVRDSELALTRITPVPEPDPAAPGTWSANVVQELHATLSYLSRFGYVPEDGLDVIVVGDPTYTEPLETMIEAPCNYTALSVHEAAQYLGIKLARGADEHYADIIHAGWAARKLAFDLPLLSREILSLKKPRQVAFAMMMLGCFGVAGVTGYAVDEAMVIYESAMNLEVATIQKKKIDDIYYEELKRKERMGIDVPLIKGSLSINKAISDARVDPLVVLEAVSRELEDIRLDGFEFANSGPEPAGKSDAGAAPTPRETTMKLKISFAGSIEPKKGNAEIDKLISRLNLRLDKLGYKAEVTKVLQDLSFKGVVDSEVGITATKRSVEDRYEGEITIRKVQSNG